MSEQRTPVNETKAWAKLKNLRKKLEPDLKNWFESDPRRREHFSQSTDHVLFDYTRQLITEEVMDTLLELAEETDLKSSINSMFAGEKINVTEQRSVLHTALRNFSGNNVYLNGNDVMPDIKAVLSKIEGFSKKIINGELLGVKGDKLKNIVSVGIGGSYLGPEYLAEVSKASAIEGMNLYFIANVDPTDFVRKTEKLNPAETLVIIVSKTFTTAETMANARAVKSWMTNSLGDDPEVIKKHFIAVSTAQKRVEEFGIDPENMFGFWDWVGGRFSATSAVGGVPLSLYLGYDNFVEILKGAFWMDQHFQNQPFEKNIPVLAGLIDLWNINFMGYKTRAIVPYSQAWHKYAAHCQQTEMESNGKSVDLSGRSVEFDTGEVIFGEPGTNSQHSYFQLLHQGSSIVPIDFIGFINPQYKVESNEEISLHEELMTNFFAQPDALAFGKENELPHKVFTGNRPSNVFLLKNQNPFAAGLLLSLLEHRTAAKGFIWGINSFDQFGVELGKELGINIRERMKLYKKDPANPEVFSGLNVSTSELLKSFMEG
ncbi:MAG: glucose-6-phosphate isomerase [Bacteroidetes bacterium]|nr:glucose-6-phosphate isomerase [Bacteroidota bacterium]